MLKKSRRIDRGQFKTFIKPYKLIHGSFFVMRIFVINPDFPSKFAVSVSKKQEKDAVKRNAIRRLVYRIISSTLSQVKNGLAIHFILQKKTINPKHDITNDIDYLISQL